MNARMHGTVAGLVGAASLALSGPAAAKAERANSSALSGQLSTLPTGDQLIVAGRSEAAQFAGRDLALDDCSALIGYSSELAYIVVVAGRARIGGVEAGPGRMLLVPAFGKKVTNPRFDATRLKASLSSQPEGDAALLMAGLQKVAKHQHTGLFFGRLARTSFNVNTLGSAREELGRREQVGGTAVRQVRFAAPDKSGAVERQIVSDFLGALAARDVPAVAEFLDPLPYGYGSFAGGGGEARRAMARSLVAERDWSPFAAAAPVKDGETTWVAGSGSHRATIDLRRTTDFAFVESIKVGE